MLIWESHKKMGISKVSMQSNDEKGL